MCASFMIDLRAPTVHNSCPNKGAGADPYDTHIHLSKTVPTLAQFMHVLDYLDNQFRAACKAARFAGTQPGRC